MVALCIAAPLPAAAQHSFRTEPDRPAHKSTTVREPTPPIRTNFDALVRKAIQNQINDKVHPPYFSWMQRDYHGDQSKVEHVVDTPSGQLSSVEYIDAQPLNAKQQRREARRVRKMIEPDALRRHKKSQQEDDKRTQRILASIPDAFNFHYEGSETAENGHKLVTLRFTPRPGFDPPNHETMVFLGMKGEITIDETAVRLTKIDGTLFRDVTFGWGIFGRLYQGGRFVVEQEEVTPTHWDTTRMFLHFDGTVLLFKSIHIEDKEISWDYKPVPAMTVEQALGYLKDHPDPPSDAMLRR